MEALKQIMKEKAKRDQKQRIAMAKNPNFKKAEGADRPTLPKVDSKESLGSLQAPVSVLSLNT